MRPESRRGRLYDAFSLGMLIAGLAASFASAQSLPKSPEEVLQAYRKMDAEGERLTVRGWYRATEFFLKPDRPPRHRVIGVMEGESPAAYASEAQMSGNHRDFLIRSWVRGQIDSSGRFTSVVAPYLLDGSGNLQKHLPSQVVRGPALFMRMYTLVLTDTYWEFGPDRRKLRKVKGPPQWKIDLFEYEPWVTIDVAIRYLTQFRERSTHELERSNAAKSIAALRHLLDR